MTTSLTDRVALVTGAAQGMGVAHARRLAAAGATVAVNDLRERAALTELADSIGGFAVPGDVSDPAECVRIADTVADTAGRLDVLVANHAYMTMAPLLEHDDADWWAVVDTNLGGTFFLVQAVLPHMRRHGEGRIVVITSEWGVTGWPEATAYAASKAGLISLVKTLGRELAPERIIVNAVAPGVTDTPQLEVDAAAAGVDLATVHAQYAQGIPLGRIGSAAEIAAAVELLADFEVSAVVGQVLSCNGGSTRSRV
ncbi:short-chain dehydrogenase [Mycolicibacterium chubuense]|uniref:3-oxoacyl-[acyl-carrier-protein] reductase MabA n=1 Tax=Mycolicibacterium chubuense TaxID=1800 RepID=A0A0J6WCN1_MYCCU|nr:SDR family oxidoreductase [Mycolicibacterium chubuense]KMO80294.1 3-oxoacyl-[acyl-carrier-protein] reductase FabG [Mycolicibacterium chubuense]ORA54796.1 short-chain dehydrogenase [Mycolicibacterium chubuense]SPY45804.1 short-chain dehydrogenase [Mycolicibacterium chubuense]